MPPAAQTPDPMAALADAALAAKKLADELDETRVGFAKLEDAFDKVWGQAALAAVSIGGLAQAAGEAMLAVRDLAWQVAQVKPATPAVQPPASAQQPATAPPPTAQIAPAPPVAALAPEQTQAPPKFDAITAAFAALARSAQEAAASLTTASGAFAKLKPPAEQAAPGKPPGLFAPPEPGKEKDQKGADGGQSMATLAKAAGGLGGETGKKAVEVGANVAGAAAGDPMAMIALAGNAKEAIGALTDPAEMASKAIGAMAQIAGGPVLDAFQKLGSQLTPFVQALDPSSVMVFNQVMKDLQATIGVALKPVLMAVTDAARNFADLLFPVTQELAPIFGKLATTVGSVMQPIFQVWTSILSATTPALQIFGDVIGGIAPVVQGYATILSAAWRTIADLLKSLLGDEYKDGMSAFRKSMEQLAVAAILAAANLAKVGQTLGFSAGGKFLDNLIEATKGGRKADTTGLGAATGGSVTNVKSFEAAQMAAAFTASGTGGEAAKTDNQWLAALSKDLEAIRGGTSGWANLGVTLEAIKLTLEVIKKALTAGGEAYDASAPQAAQKYAGAAGPLAPLLAMAGKARKRLFGEGG